MNSGNPVSPSPPVRRRRAVSCRRLGHPLCHSRRGYVFIVALGTLTLLAGMTLVFAQSMRVEGLAAANRVAYIHAAAAERGAEEFVMAAVDMEVTSPGSTSTDPMRQAMNGFRIGDAYVWIIRPDPNDETAISFGLTDEASKLDLNSATSNQLYSLPNMSLENADCVLDWRTPYATQSALGAKDSYYMFLPEPYRCKNGPYKTVEELNLVKSIATDDFGYPTHLLFGLDSTHCGHVDPAASAASTTLVFGPSNRGIFPFVTVYGIQASTAPPVPASAEVPVDINSADPADVQKVLQEYLGRDADKVLQLTLTTPRIKFASVWDWAIGVGLNSNQLSGVFDHVRFVVPGVTPFAKINVNTAPKQVLMCIPYFTQNDVDAIVGHRLTNPQPFDPADISWLMDVISTNKLRVTGMFLTGVSYCFSADILVCSADGRSFNRTRIVADASSGKTQIIYRRDLTSYGWPLDPGLRAALRNGKPISKQPLPQY